MTAKNKKRNKWLQSVFLLINFIVIAALALSYLSPVTSPETNVIPAILALFYPVFLILNILFIIWWIVRLRYYFLFSLAVIFAGYNIFFKTFCFNSEKPVGSYNDAMKVLSYNVRLFDQFKWTGNQNYFTRNSIFEFVHSEQADIVCFQEFFHGNEKYFPTIGPFLEKSGTKNYHVDYVLVKGDHKHYGLATFTKFPIVAKGSIRFEGKTSNSGIYSDIIFKGDTIRVFNFHLESVKFSKADYKFVSDFTETANPYSSNTKVILGKLRRAFKSRAKQANIVAAFIRESPYPVIVCGDFNDTPLSYVYKTVSAGLNDSFLEIGQGTGVSYAGGIPFLRIDYILHSKSLEAFRFNIHNVNYSDHYPISCYFKLNHQ